MSALDDRVLAPRRSPLGEQDELFRRLMQDPVALRSQVEAEARRARREAFVRLAAAAGRHLGTRIRSARHA